MAVLAAAALMAALIAVVLMAALNSGGIDGATNGSVNGCVDSSSDLGPWASCGLGFGLGLASLRVGPLGLRLVLTWGLGGLREHLWPEG